MCYITVLDTIYIEELCFLQEKLSITFAFTWKKTISNNAITLKNLWDAISTQLPIILQILIATSSRYLQRKTILRLKLRKSLLTIAPMLMPKHVFTRIKLSWTTNKDDLYLGSQFTWTC